MMYKYKRKNTDNYARTKLTHTKLKMAIDLTIYKINKILNF